MTTPWVIGAGPAGCCLAALLADQGWPVTLLESGAMDASSPGPAAVAVQRTLALAGPSWTLLGRLGITPQQVAAHPIRTIHVSYRGQAGRVCLDASESGVSEFGHTVSYARLLTALRAAVAARPGITVHEQAVVQTVQGSTSAARVRWRGPAGAQDSLVSLAVLAEGGALTASGDALTWPYRQQALACVVQAEQPTGDQAFERFTPDGPLALLPCAEGYALIWTAPAARIAHLLQASDADFLAALQAWFGDRLGRFRQCSPRQRYPLRGRFVLQPAGRRFVQIANAAQTLHPVAGQGFNLGLRDITTLTEALGAAQPGQDPGSATRLAAYQRARRADRWTTAGLTHLLATAFALPGSSLPMSLALGTFDLAAPLRRGFARLMAEGIAS